MAPHSLKEELYQIETETFEIEEFSDTGIDMLNAVAPIPIQPVLPTSSSSCSTSSCSSSSTSSCCATSSTSCSSTSSCN